MTFDHSTLRRHRLSALSNGVLIGTGISLVLFSVMQGVFDPVGLFGITVGIGLEFWQRSRIQKKN